MHAKHMAVYIMNVSNVFLKPLPLIYCEPHCKLIYDVLDAYFTNLSEMFFLLNHHKIWLNIPKCPQCILLSLSLLMYYIWTSKQKYTFAASNHDAHVSRNMLERLIPCKAIPSELPAPTQACIRFGDSLGDYIFLSMAVRLTHSTLYHHLLPSTSRLLAAVPSPLLIHIPSYPIWVIPPPLFRPSSTLPSRTTKTKRGTP